MTSTYFGVDFRENAWRTKITINKKHKFIGLFFDEKSAAIRYDEKKQQSSGGYSTFQTKKTQIKR